MQDSTLLKSAARYQTRPHVAVTLTSRLPPVCVVLADNVQHIAAGEIQSSFFAWDVGIGFRYVIEMSTDADFAFSDVRSAIGWDEF